ncbi:hypothetical protein [Diplocloster hominis]|uniref:hypothetical protein n=1 Tax=Diplocloster hominis TaxID=3079010 RepID=UPI0031B9FBEE
MEKTVLFCINFNEIQEAVFHFDEDQEEYIYIERIARDSHGKGYDQGEPDEAYFVVYGSSFNWKCISAVI